MEDYSNQDFARDTVISTMSYLNNGMRKDEYTFNLREESSNAWKWFLMFEKRRTDKEIRARYYDMPERRKERISTNTIIKLTKKHSSLRRFMFTSDEDISGLRDRFICTLILYITSLINIETMKWKLIMMGHKLPKDEDFKFQSSYHQKSLLNLHGNYSTDLEILESGDEKCSPEGLIAEKKRARIHLMRVSFMYSLLLQRLGRIFKRDQLGESRFFEGLTRVCVHICISQFENVEVHDLIRSEVMQLFRTTNFVDEDKKIERKKFVPTRDLLSEGRTKSNVMKHVMKFSPDRKIKFCNKRSPLIKVIYPKHLSSIGKFRSEFQINKECIRTMHKRAQLDRIKQGNVSGSGNDTPTRIRKGLGEVSEHESGKLRVEIKMQELTQQLTDMEQIMKTMRKRITEGNQIDKTLEFRKRRRNRMQTLGVHPRYRFRRALGNIVRTSDRKHTVTVGQVRERKFTSQLGSNLRKSYLRRKNGSKYTNKPTSKLQSSSSSSESLLKSPNTPNKLTILKTPSPNSSKKSSPPSSRASLLSPSGRSSSSLSNSQKLRKATSSSNLESPTKEVFAPIKISVQNPGLGIPN